MSGVSSGVGLFSGINSGQIIEQLLAIEARPRDQAQARVVQLQLQQTAFLDINSRLSALRDAAKAFRDKKTFQTRSATSSADNVLTATAGITAPNGTYQFLVDRLVSSQQVLSRGFADLSTSALGATSVTLESTQARLDRDVSLSELNNGAGVSRGKIAVTDSGGASATIDLSRATTVGEVLDAINTNGTARVTASVQAGRILIKDNGAGGGTMTVADANGYTTATSLGIAGSAAAGGTLSGSTVYALNANTTLSSLNDGLGVYIRSVAGVGDAVWNFKINVAGTDVFVNIGDVYENQTSGETTTMVKTQGAVTTVQGVVDRINAKLTSAGYTNITASIDATNGRLRIVDQTGARTLTVTENPALNSTTASDLGIAQTGTGAIDGQRVLAGLNSTLARGLNGGGGVEGDGVVNVTTRSGQTFAVNLSASTQSLQDIADAFSTQTGGLVRVTLNAKGTGLLLTDTSGGSGNLIVVGTSGDDTAASLGISTGAAGVAASTVTGTNLQRQYISRATLLESLNNGKGVGTGSFRITDAVGGSATVDVTSSTRTVGDLINLINGKGLKITARINSHGDGIEIIENTSQAPAGSIKMKIEDTTGTVARAMNLAGTASDTGASNKIDGSFERTVTLSAADTLQQVIDKINGAGAGVTAAAVRDGSGPTPYRLSLSSSTTGVRGRFIVDSGSFDLGLQTLEAGRDALVFYGSSDPARAVAVSSSSNTIDSVLPGVKIDLHGRSADPVNLTVATDTDGIVASINAFLQAFNTVAERIATQTKYDDSTKKSGPLLGDGTAIELRSSLFNTIQAAGIGTSGRYRSLSDIGVRIGTGGTLTLDQDRFRAALQEDPASVESLFTARTAVDDSQQEVPGYPGVRVRNPNSGNTFSSLGVMGQFEQLVTRYIDASSGVLTGRTQGLDAQIKLQQARVQQFTDRLDQKRSILERQFQAMESAIGKMQTQQSALASISKVG